MLSVDKSALLVIDIQERLFPLIYQKDIFLKNLLGMIKGAQILEIPILATEHVPKKIGKTIPEIAGLLTGVKTITKNTFSCLGEPLFTQELGALGRPNILIAGVETHICVYQTARDLVSAGYNVQVVTDAVSSRTAHNKVIGIERIKDSGGSVTSVETVVCELLQVAEGEKFKKILALIK